MSRELREDAVAKLLRELRGLQVANDRAAESASALMGLDRTHMRCLDLLVLQGPMKFGALAERAGLTLATATRAVEWLERAGYARRTRDRFERRGIFVEATDHAREAHDELYAPLEQSSIGLLERLTEAELELLRSFLAERCELTLAHAERLQARLEQQQEREDAVQEKRPTKRRRRA